MHDLGQNITSERLKQKITQAQLARSAGVSQPNLSAIEKGKRDMMVGTLKRISQALNVKASFLLGEEEVRDALVLTRPRIERIARLVIRGSDLKDRADDRMAALFRALLPAPGARRRSAKQTLRSWLELRRLLDQNQINSVLGRIRDAQQRAA